MKQANVWLRLALAGLACLGSLAHAGSTEVVTLLNDCDETENNVSAAYSRLECHFIGSYDLYILEQSPDVFTVQLILDGRTLETDFQALNKGLPLEPARTLKWQLEDGEPKFLLAPMSWGTQDAPFKFNQYLTVNYVAENHICTLATVRETAAADAEKKARELLQTKYAKIAGCPETAEAF